MSVSYQKGHAATRGQGSDADGVKSPPGSAAGSPRANFERVLEVSLSSWGRKFVNEHEGRHPDGRPCYLDGWKSLLAVMTVYQQADQLTMRNALSNRDNRRGVSS